MSKNFKIDTVDIPEELKDCHISSFFMETKKGHRTALSWLKTVPTSTLEMILKIMQRDIQPIPNLEEDLTAAMTQVEEDLTAIMPQEEIDEGSDMFILIHLVEHMELHKEDPILPLLIPEENQIEESIKKIKRFYILALFEYYRRHNLLIIKGSGKMTDNNTNITFTAKPIEIAKFIKRKKMGTWLME